MCYISAIKQEAIEPDVKRPKLHDKENAKRRKLDKSIEKQNIAFYKFLDKLNNETDKSEWRSILEANKQAMPDSPDEVRNMSNFFFFCNYIFN